MEFVRVPGRPLVGHLFDAWEDGPRFMLRGLLEHGDHVCFRFAHYDYRLIGDPEDVRHVLVRHHENYVKSRNYAGLRLTLGEGLVTSEGAHWKRQRKLAQPVFTPRRLTGFVDTMAACTDALLEDWERRGRGAPLALDVHREMMRLTFRIVGLTLMGVDLEGEAQTFAGALEEALHFANDYVENPLSLPPWVPTARNRRFRAAMATLDGTVGRLVRARREEGGEEDLLGMLVAATDGGERMTDAQLRDEVLTMVVAGHETTANALSWTWALLSQHPAVARRVEAEARSVLGDGPPTAADLDRLEYTERVIREALRLHPPVWIIERDALAEDSLGGYRVPAGATVAISPYALHRHPRWWANPEGFDPDRFLPERVAERPRYVYLPFGAGPRVCIGAGFALMEAKLILAMIARRHRLELEPGHPLEADPGITLRPRHGVRVRVRPAPPATRDAAA
ncbi:MAG TPA: cytochrome P450 [Polyangiaceae bacterium LLY-WYZ-15_(1-7)]|nr:cytochrome P450 [Polyangiaceae bacterium LLY-WYZ-15_(1-7)]HJL07279.1 cytochrome P450 [Polyangiaceae bacterium LLY-WYZ-15_(1-7)]HJL45596.1 cytochrome P450 [Polyangiaceae bacterium LLY-WYZ-15_(1-7)]